MSLFPGASNQRFSSALELISLVFEFCDALMEQLKEFELNDIQGFPNMRDDSLYASLLHFIINADYEPDRKKAFLLLQQIDSSTLSESLLDFQEMALQLLNSKHQSQIDAGILMSMIVYDTLKEKASGSLKFKLITDFVDIILAILKYNIAIAEQSLWKCAIENPIYPYFSVFNNLIGIKKITFDFEYIVDLVERAIQPVLVVCADDSPGMTYIIFTK